MRVKRGTVSRRKHNKLLESVKGYRGSRSRLVRTAKAASLHSGQYAFHGRKLRKRDFRTLWITRISEAVREYDMSYSVFMYKLKHANIILDRKIISDLVVNDPTAFKKLADAAQVN